MSVRTHWEKVYHTKAPTEVSWFQQHSRLSLEFIKHSEVSRTAQIIDVGGGASSLADDLWQDGYRNITVLDISEKALQVAQSRLGETAEHINWWAADIREAELPADSYDIWHDRAVFHFLTEPADRHVYLETMRRSLKSGGHSIIATFAPDGPEKCSGLSVQRYSPEELQAEFGTGFTLMRFTREDHHTPGGAIQKFLYCHFRKV
jgi:ubiquinone/menaquinone biosynthesis C-methylase UbiE